MCMSNNLRILFKYHNYFIISSCVSFQYTYRNNTHILSKYMSSAISRSNYDSSVQRFAKRSSLCWPISALYSLASNLHTNLDRP